MDVALLTWLFGTIAAALAASFGYTYTCQRVNSTSASGVARELAIYKVEVAKDFATIAHLREVEHTTLDRLNHMDGKLDRLIERLIPER